jgi:hypothetical protein
MDVKSAFPWVRLPEAVLAAGDMDRPVVNRAGKAPCHHITRGCRRNRQRNREREKWRYPIHASILCCNLDQCESRLIKGSETLIADSGRFMDIQIEGQRCQSGEETTETT